MALHPPAPAASVSLLPPASGWCCPRLGTWCALNLGCGQPQHCRHVGSRGELKIPGNGLKKKTEIPDLLWSCSAGPGVGRGLCWGLTGSRDPQHPGDSTGHPLHCPHLLQAWACWSEAGCGRLQAVRGSTHRFSPLVGLQRVEQETQNLQRPFGLCPWAPSARCPSSFLPRYPS